MDEEKDYYARNKQARKEYQRQYYIRNRERIKAKRRLGVWCFKKSVMLIALEVLDITWTDF